jgi:hypothetical protein
LAEECMLIYAIFDSLYFTKVSTFLIIRVFFKNIQKSPKIRANINYTTGIQQVRHMF